MPHQLIGAKPVSKFCFNNNFKTLLHDSSICYAFCIFFLQHERYLRIKLLSKIFGLEKAVKIVR